MQQDDPQSTPDAAALTAAATPLIPPDIRDLLGPPPLLRSEDPHNYWRLLERLAAERSPRDFTEWIYLKDTVDAMWEERRCRRMRDALIDGGITSAAFSILTNANGQAKRDVVDVTQGMLRGDAEDTATIDRALKASGLSRDVLAATSMAQNMDTIERLSRMADTCGRRRRSALSDAERHRFALSQARPDTRGAVVDLDTSAVV